MPYTGSDGFVCFENGRCACQSGGNVDRRLDVLGFSGIPACLLKVCTRQRKRFWTSEGGGKDGPE